MYQVMIVDDEPLIRMGLKRIVNWEDYGFQVVCEARDGEEALQKLTEHEIDFVVTDIRMHKMSGIEFLKTIREQGRETPVLLLSGYDEFLYAQEGLRHGAFDYMLKPLDAEKFKEILEKAYKRLSQNEKRNHEFITNKTNSQEKILYDLLRGKNLMMMDELISQYSLPLINGKVQVAIIEINDIAINVEDLMKDTERSYLEESIDRIIVTEMLGCGLKHFSIVDGDVGKKIIILQTDAEMESEALNQTFMAVLTNIHQSSNEQLKAVLNIGVGNVYNQVYSLHKSHYHAKEALKYKYVFGTNRLIHIDELSELKGEKFTYPVEKERELISSIMSGKEESYVLLVELIRDIAELMKFDMFKINIAVTQVANNIYSNVMKKYSFLGGVYDLSEIKTIGFLGAETLEDMENRFSHNIEDLISKIREYNLDQGDNIVLRACEYVLDHIEQDITLTSIANALNISKNYFCSIFKRQTGESFLDYVTKVKMDRAKVLLKKNDYKVYEVSQLLGYKETVYFSKLFKKHTGYTPVEYKKTVK